MLASEGDNPMQCGMDSVLDTARFFPFKYSPEICWIQCADPPSKRCTFRKKASWFPPLPWKIDCQKKSYFFLSLRCKSVGYNINKGRKAVFGLPKWKIDCAVVIILKFNSPWWFLCATKSGTLLHKPKVLSAELSCQTSWDKGEQVGPALFDCE